MTTAKLFKSGRSQAVRLPKEYRFRSREVVINRIGDMVVLYPKGKGWKLMKESLSDFTDDFMADRAQPPKPQERRKL
jgi:antitoxin VapB